MGCQKTIAYQIVEAGADYVLASRKTTRALPKVYRFVEWYWPKMLGSRGRKGYVPWEVFHLERIGFTPSR